MPSLEYLRSTALARTPRVVQVEGMFDLDATESITRRWTAELPLDAQPWSIGLIVGPSGSGKSTLLSECFDIETTERQWAPDAAVVDGFPEHMSIVEVCALLGSVGFSSPPAWLRPYRTLSNGERFRVDVARALADDAEVTLLDEFTSVVDRTVAQIASAAIAKHIRKTDRKLVAASCHYDIIDWLGPDWIYDTGSDTFTWRSLHPRPPIILELARCSRSWWSLFHHHHYLSDNLSRSCDCFVGFVGERPAVFVAVGVVPSTKGYAIRREHRTVCLPDFQGVGIGNATADLVASIYRGVGKRYRSTTSHPAMIAHRARSSAWLMDRKPSFVAPPSATSKTAAVSMRRLTASFEYVGPKAPAEQTQLLDVRQADIERGLIAGAGQHDYDSGAQSVGIGVPVG